MTREGRLHHKLSKEFPNTYREFVKFCKKVGFIVNLDNITTKDGTRSLEFTELLDLYHSFAARIVDVKDDVLFPRGSRSEDVFIKSFLMRELEIVKGKQKPLTPEEKLNQKVETMSEENDSDWEYYSSGWLVKKGI